MTLGVNQEKQNMSQEQTLYKVQLKEGTVLNALINENLKKVKLV